MKTEDIRATETALTPYLTVILFSTPGNTGIDDRSASCFMHGAPTLAGASATPEERFPPLAELPETSPVHF